MCLSIVSTNSFSAATKPTLIHAIQGAGDASPLAGSVVTIEAIVVGDFQARHGAHGNLRGFFVQEEDADADDHLNTSEGLFVYTGASPKVDVNVGDVVQVTGFVKEFYGLTELADVTQVSVLSSGNGLTPSSGLAELVAALNQHMGKNTYAYVKSGTIGTDAIRVGLLYKPLSVTPVGGHAILDSTVDPLFLDTKNRPVLLQTFEEVQTKERFSVAVAHFKSKGSSCADVDDPDTGDGQGNCTGVRTAAAVAINRWIDTDPTHSGDPDVLLLGDLNAYANEDPIRVLTRAGWINEVPQAYSYVFDGQTGTLDYALTSPSLHTQVTCAEVWHINADEADALDYNTDYGRPQGLYSPSEYRSSDHDPVVIGLSLATAL